MHINFIGFTFAHNLIALPIMKITDVKEKEVVHCQTEAEAIRICNLMHEAGMEWSNGQSYIKETGFGSYESGICYLTHEGVCAEVRFFANEKYKIIPSTEITAEDELVPAPENLFVDEDNWKITEDLQPAPIQDSRMLYTVGDKVISKEEYFSTRKSIGENVDETSCVSDADKQKSLDKFLAERRNEGNIVISSKEQFLSLIDVAEINFKTLIVTFDGKDDIDRVGGILDRFISKPHKGSWVEILNANFENSRTGILAANILKGFSESMYRGQELGNSYIVIKSSDITIPSETKAERRNEGKLQWSLVDFPSLKPMVEVLGYGSLKYAPENWRKGLPVRKQIDSLLRHVTAIAAGVELDEESGLSHIGHAQCNLMFLAWTLKNKPELDDR